MPFALFLSIISIQQTVLGSLLTVRIRREADKDEIITISEAEISKLMMSKRKRQRREVSSICKAETTKIPLKEFVNRILCHHPTFYRAAQHEDPEKCKKMVKLDSSHDHKKIEITKCKRNKSYTESRLAQMSKIQIQDTCEQLTVERRNHKHSLELLDGSHSCSYNVIPMEDHFKHMNPTKTAESETKDCCIQRLSNHMTTNFMNEIGKRKPSIVCNPYNLEHKTNPKKHREDIVLKTDDGSGSTTRFEIKLEKADACLPLIVQHQEDF